ncbi:MAG: alpha/beta hydrolase [Caulobacterales bacterium]|jgi:predicted alpha/beta superfamily hydrolase|nr:alpha/beta hydrolase [Caulobacterales bacterium]
MRFVLIAIALILSACATAPSSAQEGAAISVGASYTLTSQVLGDERQINIRAPQGGEEGRRYTTLYVIDGALDQDFTHIAGLGQLGELSWQYEPLIIVGVQTRTRIHELTPPATDARYRSAFPNAGGAAAFRRFLEREMIPFVEARYPTGARRAVMGESLAGLFVVDTMLQQPALFNDYIAISPSLWWDDRSLARGAGDALARHDTSDRRLYLAIANEGGTMQDGVDRLRRAIDATPGRISLHYADRSATDSHSTIYHAAALDALRALYAIPPYDYGPSPWYMIEGASPPATTP